MGLLKRIGNGSVFIDTAPFVYFIERKQPYADLLRPVFNAIDAGELRAFTSTISCSETLVIPCRQGNQKLISTYETLLTETPDLAILPFDLPLARKTAEIRAAHGTKTPDAIQWATAVRCGVRFFLTNDKGFKKFSKPEVLLLDDFLS